MEVRYLKCDLCGKEIKKEHYVLSIEPMTENCVYNGGKIDVCYNCIDKLRGLSFHTGTSYSCDEEINPIRQVVKLKPKYRNQIL